MISDPDIFLSLPSYLNVLQSSHQVWLFFSEIMFYGYLPWETLIASTTANWRKIMMNSSSCSDFASKDDYLSSRYFPRWRWNVVRDYINSSSDIDEVGRQLQDTAVFPDKKGYFHMNIARLKDFEISAELKYEFNPHNNSVVKITKQWLEDFMSWSKSHFRNGSASFR